MSRKIPEVLSQNEQENLLSQFNTRYISSQRNKTMISLFLDSGLRLAEATNLKWQNINLLSGQLKVIEGKGKKERILWLNEERLEALETWKERQYKEWGKSEFVFPSRTGKQLDGKAVRKMINTYSLKAGITKSITTHTLRHSFASDLLRQSKNIRLVQKALGHSNISTTQIYTHIVDDELETTLKTFRKSIDKSYNKKAKGNDKDEGL